MRREVQAPVLGPEDLAALGFEGGEVYWIGLALWSPDLADGIFGDNRPSLKPPGFYVADSDTVRLDMDNIEILRTGLDEPRHNEATPRLMITGRIFESQFEPIPDETKVRLLLVPNVTYGSNNYEGYLQVVQDPAVKVIGDITLKVLV